MWLGMDCCSPDMLVACCSPWVLLVSCNPGLLAACDSTLACRLLAAVQALPNQVLLRLPCTLARALGRQGPGALANPHGTVSNIHACLGAYSSFFLAPASQYCHQHWLRQSCETLGVGVMRALLETLSC